MKFLQKKNKFILSSIYLGLFSISLFSKMPLGDLKQEESILSAQEKVLYKPLTKEEKKNGIVEAINHETIFGLFIEKVQNSIFKVNTPANSFTSNVTQVGKLISLMNESIAHETGLKITDFKYDEKAWFIAIQELVKDIRTCYSKEKEGILLNKRFAFRIITKKDHTDHQIQFEITLDDSSLLRELKNTSSKEIQKVNVIGIDASKRDYHKHEKHIIKRAHIGSCTINGTKDKNNLPVIVIALEIKNITITKDKFLEYINHKNDRSQNNRDNDTLAKNGINNDDEEEDSEINEFREEIKRITQMFKDKIKDIEKDLLKNEVDLFVLIGNYTDEKINKKREKLRNKIVFAYRYAVSFLDDSVKGIKKILKDFKEYLENEKKGALSKEEEKEIQKFYLKYEKISNIIKKLEIEETIINSFIKRINHKIEVMEKSYSDQESIDLILTSDVQSALNKYEGDDKISLKNGQNKELLQSLVLDSVTGGNKDIDTNNKDDKDSLSTSDLKLLGK